MKKKTTKRKKRRSSRKRGGVSRWLHKHRLALWGCLVVLLLGLVVVKRERLASWVHRQISRPVVEFVPKEHHVNGSLYIGNWKREQPHGIGVMQLENGTVLAGEWKAGKRHGIFRERTAEGKTTYSEWKDDKRVRKIPLVSVDKVRGSEGRKDCEMGIDISAWQAESWGAMLISCKKDGKLSKDNDGDYWLPVDFVIMRASGQKTIIDSRYKYHSRMASLLGIPQGAYHCYSNGLPIDEQIEGYLKQIQGVSLAFPPILDIEGSTKEISPKHFKKSLPKYLKWLKEVEKRTGKKPMIYCCYDFYDAYAQHSELKDYEFWIAGYSRSKYPKNCPIRQISKEGRLVGWKGEVDVDVRTRHTPPLPRREGD